MSDYSAHFKGKKITIMGLGLLGRGVGDAEFLAKNGAILTITDLKNEEALQTSLERLKQFENISYTLGEHKLEDFKDKDFILKAAGVPLDSPYIEEARKNNIPIKMSASWFAELTNIPIVGVTGTRGKTTTTYLLYEILKQAGKHVLLGGNIRGVSTLSLLDEVKNDSIALFELDSWQLQGFGESHISPDISVFTTFMDDHLNYYGGDREKYFNDKAQIFLHQTPGSVLIYGDGVSDLIRDRSIPDSVQEKCVSAKDFKDSWKFNLPGEHNKLNAMCAYAAAKALDIDDKTIIKAFEEFTAIEGRLQLVKEMNGVKIYNDTTATTPRSTQVALESLDTGNHNIILIMGGSDKALDATKLVNTIPKHTKKVIALEGSGTEKIKPQLEKEANVMIYHNNLESAVHEAWESAEPGDIILFSPGFASFDMFKNEYDRGDQFNTLIETLS